MCILSPTSVHLGLHDLYTGARAQLLRVPQLTATWYPKKRHESTTATVPTDAQTKH